MAERKDEAEAQKRQIQDKQRDLKNSFEKIAREWWTWWAIGKSPRHAETVMSRMEADVFPVIGHLQVDAVGPQHIREILLTNRDARRE